jgi:hypothetical protein
MQMGKAWMIQLLSVSCLSLAVKMEEVEAPLLLDLQVSILYLSIWHTFCATNTEKKNLQIRVLLM